jgi:YVTN family beta-propeller protein
VLSRGRSPAFHCRTDSRFSADDGLAIICDPQGDASHVADVADRKVLWSENSLGSPKGVMITPDNSMAFVTLNGDRSVAAIDLATRQVLGKVGVGVSPDGVG